LKQFLSGTNLFWSWKNCSSFIIYLFQFHKKYYPKNLIEIYLNVVFFSKIFSMVQLRFHFGIPFRTYTSCGPYTTIYIRNISGAKQSLRANHVNFNLDHRINLQGEDAGGGRGDSQKCDYPIQGQTVNCKITLSPMSLGCWSVVSD